MALTDEQLSHLVIKAERARGEVKTPVVLWHDDITEELTALAKDPSVVSATLVEQPAGTDIEDAHVPVLGEVAHAALKKAAETHDGTWLGKIVGAKDGHSAYAELRPRDKHDISKSGKTSLVMRVSINNQVLRNKEVLKGGIVVSMTGTAALSWLIWYTMQQAVEEARERLVPEQIKALREMGASWMLRANMPETQQATADALAASAKDLSAQQSAVAEEQARLKALSDQGALPPTQDASAPPTPSTGTSNPTNPAAATPTIPPTVP